MPSVKIIYYNIFILCDQHADDLMYDLSNIVQGALKNRMEFIRERWHPYTAKKVNTLINLNPIVQL